MPKKLLFSMLVMALVALPLLTACTSEETPTSPATTSSPTSTTSTTPTEPANWWDKWGEPQYGGSIAVVTSDTLQTVNFDCAVWGGWDRLYWEGLFVRTSTTDPAVFAFETEFAPADCYGNGLAESWEQTGPLTVTVHLHDEAVWQNKPPLNGRPLTAYDVEYSYDRILGTGNGFTEPNGMLAPAFPSIERVVAVDDHTVEFRLKSWTAWTIYEVFDGGFQSIVITAPELVEGGYMENWEDAVGSGPWMLTDFTIGSSITYSRNPDYWLNDARFPENQLPYLDEVTLLAIPDVMTQIASLRTGKIDILEFLNRVTWQQAATIEESNPEIIVGDIAWPGPGCSFDMRVDQEPFTDIRVRKALQMAVNREVIAQTVYAGHVSGKAEGLIYPGFEGYTLPFDEWPEELQAEYSYNAERAKELLAEAGYPDGFDTEIVISADEDMQVLQAVQSYFADIGVNMVVSETFPDMPAMGAYTRAGLNMQMTASNTAGVPRSPAQIILNRTADRSGGSNNTHSNDPHYEELVDKVLNAATTEEAKEYCTELDLYALSQHWSVNLYSTSSPIFWQPWLKGNNGEWLGGGALAGSNFARWWIDQDVKASMQ